MYTLICDNFVWAMHQKHYCFCFKLIQRVENRIKPMFLKLFSSLSLQSRECFQKEFSSPYNCMIFSNFRALCAFHLEIDSWHPIQRESCMLIKVLTLLIKILEQKPAICFKISGSMFFCFWLTTWYNICTNIKSDEKKVLLECH